MADESTYVLHTDVQFIEAEKLAPILRDKLQAESGQYIVSKKGSRFSGKLISRNAKDLLECFKRESKISQAIKEYATQVNADAVEVLERVYPLLSDLVARDWLVQPNNDSAAALTFSLAPGDEIAGYTVAMGIQLLEDGEVYKLEKKNAHAAALKLLRPTTNPKLRKSIRREVLILQSLREPLVPAVLGTGQIEGNDFLLISWIEGISAGDAAQQIRRLPLWERQRAFKKFGIEILKAYESLHAQGVMHGDIHPRNIILRADGKASLIDFANSYSCSLSPELGEPSHFGMAYFKTPERARARLEDRKLPLPSPASEQFALGALLYFLYLGKHYTDFSIDYDTQLRQVIESPPKAFASRGAESWKEMEGCLSKMMAKNPEERFESMSDCLRTFSSVPPVSRRRLSSPISLAPKRHLCREYESILQNPTYTPHLNSPKASFNYGAAGLAYAFYRESLLDESPQLLALADRFAVLAASMLHEEGALVNHRLGVETKTVGDISLYHSASGIHFTQALISHAMGDVVSCDEAIGLFVKSAELPSKLLDFTLGWSGVLRGSLLLSRMNPKNEGLKKIQRETFEKLSEIVRQSDENLIHPAVPCLGLAHGWCGILYALLSSCLYDEKSPEPKLEALLHALMGYAHCSKVGVSWPRMTSSKTVSAVDCDNASWCNGSAGYVWLWGMAYKIYGEKEFLKLATEAASHALHHPDLNPNLCCGLAGRAFAMIHMFQVTGQKRYLDHAQTLYAAARTGDFPQDFSDLSLLKGSLGVDVLGFGLRDPMYAVFPGMD